MTGAWRVTVSLKPPHSHVWFRFHRQRQPRADVYDCACGARKHVYLGADGYSEIEVAQPRHGGSVNNCLDARPEGEEADHLGTRMRLLASQQEMNHG